MPDVVQSQYKVAIVHEDDGELGTLEQQYTERFAAEMAAQDNSIPEVGIHAEVRDVDNEP